ncbi:MAG TPA: MmcQ/YjbR family DNA-binding protein, partial [Actinomycetes bacterium]|nr:MmcQ/YjbR family DNA-binding protein [Actinomycetes bacterium]
GDTWFTTPHFNGFPAILVQLDRVHPADLEELLVEAWLARAPKRLAREFLDTR